jgi:hypothetical protein
MSSQGVSFRHRVLATTMGSIELDETTTLSLADTEGTIMPQSPKKRDQMSVSKQLFFKSLSLFWTVKVCELLCIIYILVMTCFYIRRDAGPLGSVGGLVNPTTGTIIDPNLVELTREGVILVNGDYRLVVAANTFQMVCLVFSRRVLAFSSYPVLVFVYLSKCRALCSFLSNTAFSIYLFQDMHELHVYVGKYIFVDGLIHTWFHFVRWWDQNNLYLLVEHQTGITGNIAVLLVILISLPMMIYKRQIKYETCKMFH